MRNVIIFIVSLFFATSAQAMMAAKQPGQSGGAESAAQEATAQQAKHPHGEKIYFLSFDGKYLRTTAGAIYAPAVTIVNHGKVDLRQLKDTDKVEIKFTVVDRVVRQVDIYP